MNGARPHSDDPADLYFSRALNRGLIHISPARIGYLLPEKGDTRSVYEFILAEPYATITGYFLDQGYKEIIPVDSESMLLMKKLPVTAGKGPHGIDPVGREELVDRMNVRRGKAQGMAAAISMDDVPLD